MYYIYLYRAPVLNRIGLNWIALAVVSKSSWYSIHLNENSLTLITNVEGGGLTPYSALAPKNPSKTPTYFLLHVLWHTKLNKEKHFKIAKTNFKKSIFCS